MNGIKRKLTEINYYKTMNSSSYMCDNMFQSEMTDSNNSNSIYDEVANEINNVLKTSLKPILDTMEQKK